MKKTVLLTQKPNGLSTTVSKWLYMMLGVFNSLNGIDRLTSSPSSSWTLFFGLLLLLCGFLMFILGLILFHPTNKFSPRFVIDDNEVTVREDVFYRTKLIKWSDLKRIEFKSSAVEFLFNDNRTQLIKLPKTGEKVSEIKNTLRELADKKLITVNGG